jgi:hypothetical protein
MAEGEHRVDPGDEWTHRATDELLWNESYYFDVVTDQADLAAYLRIGRYPNLGVTWWTTMVVGSDRPTVSSVAYDAPLAGADGLTVSGDGLEVAMAVVDPLVEMRVTASAPAAVHDDAADIYRDEPGDPTTLDIDLTWASDGLPYHYEVTTRYEVPCLVTGELTVAGERFTVDSQGQRDHSWGVRDWWEFGWCWAACRLDDGTRVHVADIRIPGMPMAFGYLQPPGGPCLPVDGLVVTESLGPEGLPNGGRAVVSPTGLALTIEPVAFGPLLLTAPDGRTSRFPRAAARFVADDGRQGMGWIEWNQPDPPMAAR